ncbi:hypothetical protein [Aeromicrobium sp.]|uniref:hypothetical protein n=1 Tax=Aeromicrobium sp. TaxID=1871063 RepID=UPI004034C6AE
MNSSLREYDSLPDRLRLHRQVETRAILIVEGPTDSRFLRSVLPIAADYFVAGGRRDVIEACGEAVNAHKIGRIAGIVDRDFDDFVQSSTESGLPIVSYENADLEAAIFNSSALEDLLTEFAVESKLEALGGVEGVRERVREILRPVSILRRANALQAWGLAFDNVSLEGRLKISSPELNVRDYVAALLRNSPRHSASDGAPLKAVENDDTPMCPDSASLLFRGRDAAAVLAVLLRRVVGSLSHQQSSADSIERMMRVSASGRPVDEDAPWVKRLRGVLGEAA